MILITGVGGQDGYLLARHFLLQGEKVAGLARTRTPCIQRLEIAFPDFLFFSIDMNVRSAVCEILDCYSFSVIFHLASQSFVNELGDMPENQFDQVNCTYNLLHALVNLPGGNRPHLFFAGSSEMFGHPEVPLQDETTEFRPISGYGVAKVAQVHLLEAFASRYHLRIGIFILYNHESFYRPEIFFTKKVCSHVAKKVSGTIDYDEKLPLGSLSGFRDWSHALEIVGFMDKLARQEFTGRVVIGGGVAKSVEEFLELAFGKADLDWNDHVFVSSDLSRTEPQRLLQADCSKLEGLVGRRPAGDLPSLVDQLIRDEMFYYRNRSEPY